MLADCAGKEAGSGAVEFESIGACCVQSSGIWTAWEDSAGIVVEASLGDGVWATFPGESHRVSDGDLQIGWGENLLLSSSDYDIVCFLSKSEWGSGRKASYESSCSLHVW
jgi:hypothetical protein